MKRFFTTHVFSSLIIVLFGSMLILTSCSTSEAAKNSQNNSSEKTFIFRDGQDTYRVEFDRNKISSLYKNESKIPDNEIDNYKDLVEYELKNLTKDIFVKKEKPKRIRIFIDKEESEKDTTQSEEDKKDCHKFFRFKIDEDLRTQLDSLMKELNDKDFEVYINPYELREQMKEFRKHFRNFTLPELPEIDMEEFNKEMKKFNEQLKRQKPLIDSLEIELREKLKELKKLKKENKEI